MTKASYELDLDTKVVRNRLGKIIDKNTILFEEQVMKDSNYYIPLDTGMLEASVIKDWASHKGKGYLLWDVDYAHDMYYGEHLNFSKDKNPNARAKWFEEAKANNLKTWVKIAKGDFE